MGTWEAKIRFGRKKDKELEPCFDNMRKDSSEVFNFGLLVSKGLKISRDGDFKNLAIFVNLNEKIFAFIFSMKRIKIG